MPVAGFIAWFFAYDTGTVPGASGVAQSFLHGPSGFNYVASLAQFVVSGLEASAAGTVGAPAAFGLTLLSMFVALIGIHWYRRKRVDTWQFGMAAGLVAWFILAGLGRVQFGASYAAQSRYIYVAAVFLLPLLADVVSDIPWKGLWRPLLTGAFAFCLFGNAVQLRDLSVSQKDYMRLQAAELQTVQVFQGAPDMALPSPIDDSIMPQFTAGQYLAAVSELGSPVPRLTFGELQRLPGQWVDRVMVDVFGPALSSGSDPESSTRGLSCRTVEGSTFDLEVSDRQPLTLRSNLETEARMSLGYLDPSMSAVILQAHVMPGVTEWVHLPDTGKAIIWHLRITTAGAETFQLCINGSLQVTGAAVNLYAAEASSGLLDPGWLSVPDVDARGGRSAEAPRGNSQSFRNDVFGPPVIPVSEPYDVWYRVRVASTAGSKADLTLGLWDDQGARWVGSTTYRSDQVGTSYSWIKVASGVTPVAGHSVQFIASLIRGPGTDWYIDEAVAVTAGSAPPT